MDAAEKKNIKNILKISAGILCAGLIYAWIVIPSGFSIPCKFHALTGLSCPGCGVTRMCLALLRGDWMAAYQSNMGLFLALPFLFFSICVMAYRYVFGTANKNSYIFEKRCSVVLLIYLLIWFVSRNILHI